MDIELLTFTLAAGATAQFAKAGRYIEIIEADYGIASITLTDESGGQSAVMRNTKSGLYAEVAFKQVDIVNGATAQTITLLVTDGRGGSRRQPGNVVIVDSVSPSVQTVALQNLPVTAFTASALLLPAANVRGAIVRGCALEVQAGAGGNSDCALLAAPAAPVASVGANLLTFGRLVDGASVRQVYNTWDLKRQIPAGWGLYLCTVNVTAPAVANSARASFELL